MRPLNATAHVIVAIHQPNFFPWLGYFNKMTMSDTFVVLDHVEGLWRSSWLTRNRVLSGDRVQWLSLPVRRSHQQPVPATEVRVQWDNRIVGQGIRALEASYGAHPHFEEALELVERAYASRCEHIAELNLSVIEEIRQRLGVETQLVRSSDLLRSRPGLEDLRASELLVEICRIVGADEYVSGEGSVGYIDPPAFESAGIAFSFQRFAHPVYPQGGRRAFVSHLSVIDALFNVGFEGVRQLVAGDTRERVTTPVRP